MRISSTEIQNNFGKYLKIASDLEDVIVTRNRRDVAKLTVCDDRPEPASRGLKRAMMTLQRKPSNAPTAATTARSSFSVPAGGRSDVFPTGAESIRR